MYTNKLHSRSNKSIQNVCKINMYGRRVLRTITSYYTYYKESYVNSKLRVVVGTHKIQVYNNICALQWQINSEVQSYVTKEMRHSLSLHILKAWHKWKDLGKEGTNSNRLDLMDDMTMTENVWSFRHSG